MLLGLTVYQSLDNILNRFSMMEAAELFLLFLFSPFGCLTCLLYGFGGEKTRPLDKSSGESYPLPRF